MATSDIRKGPLYVDSTNNSVGIGTTTNNQSSSTTSVTLNAASGMSAYELRNADVFSGYVGNTGTNMYLVNAKNGSLGLYTNNTERMRIDSSGNVGIGVSSMTNKLVLPNAAYFAMRDTGGAESLAIRANSSNAMEFLTGGGVKATIDSSGNLKCVGVYNQSAADSANVVVDASGNIYRSTSALKYKQDIRDIEEIDINQFRPIRYKSNLNRDDQTKDHFGFIADEAHDAGYTELVSYGAVNEETGIAEVEGFRYDRMTVLLTKVVQQQQETITALEARIAALEAN